MSTSAERAQIVGAALSVALAVALCPSALWAQETAPAAPVTPAAPAAASAPAAQPSAADRVGVAELSTLARHDDAVVLIIGDVELRRSDVFQVLDLAAPGRSAEVLQQMMLTTAAELDARREGLDVPAALLAQRIEEAIAEQRVSFALEVDETMPLEEYLQARHGLSPERYRAEVRRMVLAALLLERAVRLDQWRIDRDECAVILVEDQALASDLAEQLRAGASFSVLARRHSLHESAAAGGELGIVPTGLALPLLAGREALAPGEILGPEPIEQGERRYWRILRLVDRAAADSSPWPQLRDRIEAALAERPLQAPELALFEARVIDRYRVRRLPDAP
ncbi:MAG: peptidylprolyl isomerase [Planctomycetota bacterium]